MDSWRGNVVRLAGTVTTPSCQAPAQRSGRCEAPVTGRVVRTVSASAPFARTGAATAFVPSAVTSGVEPSAGMDMAEWLLATCAAAMASAKT